MSGSRFRQSIPPRPGGHSGRLAAVFFCQALFTLSLAWPGQCKPEPPDTVRPPNTSPEVTQNDWGAVLWNPELRLRPARREELFPGSGHRPYADAHPSDLHLVAIYGKGVFKRNEYLGEKAAVAFSQMKVAADREGVRLVVVSGFRDRGRQQKLFAKQILKKGSLASALRWSAPPGYSEHHTGLALDLGDGALPGTDLKTAFEHTPASRWLRRNAVYFGFELSYPPRNPLGVAYEPWHWRFIGSASAWSLFHGDPSPSADR